MELSVKYFAAAIVFFIAGTFWGVAMTLPPVHEYLEAIGPDFHGMISGAHSHTNTIGWVSLTLMGVIYYLLPKITEKKIYSERLAAWQFYLIIAGLTGMVLSLLAAAITGGNLYIAEKSAEIESTIAPFMILVTLFAIVLFVSFLIFAYNVLKTLTQKSAA